VPLHAATVEVDGEAVSFAGPSGAGKSTLADAFARHGHRVLSDDVSPVDLTRAIILPSLQRIRMWADSLDNAGFDTAALERCRIGLEKYSRSLKDAPRSEALPPRAIFHLRRQWEKRGGASFRRLRGRAAAEQLRRQIYRWRSLVGLVGEPEAMARNARAAALIPSHFIIERPLAFGQLDGLVDDIVATVRAARQDR
jgi:energy-coupling factor transporter ATP-binding protein EcfA2